MITIKERFVNAWLAFTKHQDEILWVKWKKETLEHKLQEAKQDNVHLANQAYREMTRANEAVRLLNEAEAGRKAASDALGDKIIKGLYGS